MRPSRLLASLLAGALLAPHALAQCNEWTTTFGSPHPGTDRSVSGSAVFDDGSGPALYLSGSFSRAGTTMARGIVRWDATGWSALAQEPGGSVVYPLRTYDDGGGTALYAGASGHVMRWKGTNWEGLGTVVSTTTPSIRSFTAFDDGNGLAFYAGGHFEMIGGVSANNIGRWNGTGWSPLGAGIEPFSGYVNTMTAYDDGTGPALYVGGTFRSASGIEAHDIARWDGTTWSGVGGGMSGLPGFFSSTVSSLTTFDDGTGAKLYAGGDFFRAGGTPAYGLACWDGTTWSGFGSTDFLISSLGVFDDGTGPALYASGEFGPVNGVPAYNIVRWDGTTWSALGPPGVEFSGGSILEAFDDGGGGRALYCGGTVKVAGTITSQNIARWNGTTWSAVGPAEGNGIPFAGTQSQQPVEALAIFDEGTGDRLFVAGGFAVPGTGIVDLARWDGSQWSGLPLIQANIIITSLGVFDDGGGAALYVGGRFTLPSVGSNVVRWNGTSWSGVGGGLSGPFVHVDSFVPYDDGNGPALYTTGTFDAAGGVPVNNVARWDGTSWSALGAGLDREGRALAVYDDGSGPGLYVGGRFTHAGGVPAAHVARWDGTSWSALGAGLGGHSGVRCEALAVYDDGSGAKLYAGGRFGGAGDVTSRGIVRWDGTSWSAVGGNGVSGHLNRHVVYSLFVFDDGTGPALFIGGEELTNAIGPDGVLMRWDGRNLTHEGPLTVAGPPYKTVRAFASFDDGTGERLVVGGRFMHVELFTSSLNLAELVPLDGPACSNGTGVPFCFGDGSDVPCPCGNDGTTGHGCASSAGPLGARLEASGDPATSTVLMHGSDLPASAMTVLVRSRPAAAPTTPFGDGLLCVGTPITRVRAATASLGRVDVPVTHASGPGRFHYQLWYRDPAVGACDPTAFFNLSNAFWVAFP